MKREELESGLKRLYLNAIAKDYVAIAKEHETKKRSYEQYLASLVDLELQDKDRLRQERLIKAAKIPVLKLIEDYDFSKREGITAQVVSRLCEGDFVRKAGNVVFYGSFGLGKSHLAMAITRNLCQKGFRCLYTSTASFVNELCAAQKTLTLSSLFKRLDRYDLITLDELGYTPQSQEGADLFFQLISQRYERRSLMITTNLVYSEWGKVFMSSTATAAAVDRIIHNCETFNLQGESWRARVAKEALTKKDKNNLDMQH